MSPGADGYPLVMPGEDDGLTPDAAPTDAGHDHHSRIADKVRFSGRPQADGVPAEEDVDAGDVEEQLERDPEDVSENRRDVSDTPENSYEARTEGGPTP
jgi:hypothetical protein